MCHIQFCVYTDKITNVHNYITAFVIQSHNHKILCIARVTCKHFVFQFCHFCVKKNYETNGVIQTTLASNRENVVMKY